MSIRIRFGNVWAWADGLTPGRLEDALDQALSYPVQGAEWSLLHEAGIWDGRKHLLRRKDCRFPTGLLMHAVGTLRAIGIEPVLIDERGYPPGRRDDVPEFFVHPPGGKPWRPYQQAAIDEALLVGRGVVVAPPRAGKTLVGAAIVGTLGRKTLWVAPTNAIVDQTARVLRGQFGDEHVGVVGAGDRDTGRRFTVSTAAGAAALPKEWLADVEALMLDEFHHSSAPSIQQIARNCPRAFYRFGMTGTHFRIDGRDMEMHAIAANELVRISVGDLVRDGYLAPALIFMQSIAHKVRAKPTEARKIGVVHHAERNAAIVHWVRKLCGLGRKVVVLVEQIDHGKALSGWLPAGTEFARSGRADFTSGQIDRFTAGEVPVLVGTSILGEGVDLPRADALVFARSGKAATTVWQSIFRVLTAYPGKERAVIVDFSDEHQRLLRAWAQERRRLYASEPSFDLRDVPPLEAASYAHPSLPLS